VKGRARPASRRHNKRRVINYKRLVLAVLMLALSFELIWAALSSPLFYIKKKVVVGNKTVPAADILGRLHLPPDANIFLLKKKDLELRVMTNPTVKAVRLYRTLPGTLAVRIEEREPDLILKTASGMYEVDASGIPFRKVKSSHLKSSVVWYGKPRRVTLGRRFDDPIFAAARRCLHLARAKSICQEGKITVDQNNDLCLNVWDGFEFRLGRPEQLSEKLDIASRLVRQTPGIRESDGYMDMSCLKAPALNL
jgi:cell division protein FtsQ